jgi:transcriptional regulator with PAS, ATPase and Fis domain
MHYEVDQSEGKYVGINCTNINREMFESELFGYKKGAFTGANEKGHQGYIKQAEQGTLFLDEISELDMEIQVKLLRVLEEREYYPLGSNAKETVNCRMIFASNKNLGKLVEKGELRKDLYYRLNIINVKIPSLQERKEEIVPFLTSFIVQLNEEFQKDVRYIQGKFLKYMYQYNWPGNIRELKNFITQIMVFIEGDTIKYEHLQTKDELDRLNTQSLSDNLYSKNRSKAEIIDELLKEPLDLEKFTMDIVRAALKKFTGNKSKTAQFLHLKREQLYNRYKID